MNNRKVFLTLVFFAILACLPNASAQNLESAFKQASSFISSNNQSAALNKALLAAAKYESALAVENLLKAGAEIETTDNLFRTPLLIAAERHDDEVIRVLLRYQAN